MVRRANASSGVASCRQSSVAHAWPESKPLRPLLVGTNVATGLLFPELLWPSHSSLCLISFFASPPVNCSSCPPASLPSFPSLPFPRPLAPRSLSPCLASPSSPRRQRPLPALLTRCPTAMHPQTAGHTPLTTPPRPGCLVSNIWSFLSSSSRRRRRDSRNFLTPSSHSRPPKCLLDVPPLTIFPPAILCSQHPATRCSRCSSTRCSSKLFKSAWAPTLLVRLSHLLLSSRCSLLIFIFIFSF